MSGVVGYLLGVLTVVGWRMWARSLERDAAAVLTAEKPSEWAPEATTTWACHRCGCKYTGDRIDRELHDLNHRERGI